MNLALYSRPYNIEARGEMPIAADKFWAMADRCRKRANETTKPGLRDVYLQLTLGYTRLAVQREAIEHCHSVVGRFDRENIAADPSQSVRATIG